MIHEPSGERFVHVAAIMHPMIPLVDGLPVTTFKGDKKTYLALDVAIRWVEEEMRHHSGEKYEQILAVLRRFESGDTASAGPT